MGCWDETRVPRNKRRRAEEAGFSLLTTSSVQTSLSLSPDLKMSSEHQSPSPLRSPNLDQSIWNPGRLSQSRIAAFEASCEQAGSPLPHVKPVGFQSSSGSPMLQARNSAS